MEELKRCPFCGSGAYISSWDDESLWSHNEVKWYQVICSDCDAEAGSSENKDEAIEAWNKRA